MSARSRREYFRSNGLPTSNVRLTLLIWLAGPPNETQEPSHQAASPFPLVETLKKREVWRIAAGPRTRPRMRLKLREKIVARSPVSGLDQPSLDRPVRPGIANTSQFCSSDRVQHPPHLMLIARLSPYVAMVGGCINRREQLGRERLRDAAERAALVFNVELPRGISRVRALRSYVVVHLRASFGRALGQYGRESSPTTGVRGRLTTIVSGSNSRAFIFRRALPLAIDLFRNHSNGHTSAP